MERQEFQMPFDNSNQYKLEGLEEKIPKKEPTTEIKLLKGSGEISKIANAFLNRLEKSDFTMDEQGDMGQVLEPDQLINAIILIKKNNPNNPTLIPDVLKSLSEPEISSIADFISQQDRELFEGYLKTFGINQEIVEAIEKNLGKKKAEPSEAIVA